MRQIIFLIFPFLIFACSSNYLSSFEEGKKIFLQAYPKSDLFNHFPNKVNPSSVVSGHFEPSDNSNCFGIMLLTLKQDDKTINDFKNNNYFAKGYYNNDSFTVVKNELLIDSSSSSTFYGHNFDSFYPIPDFTSNDFLLGNYPDSVFQEEEFIPITKYIIPDDLFVCILEANFGDFWKDGCRCIHNELLDKWKNGFSRGVAISEKYGYVTYWAVAW